MYTIIIKCSIGTQDTRLSCFKIIWIQRYKHVRVYFEHYIYQCSIGIQDTSPSCSCLKYLKPYICFLIHKSSCFYDFYLIQRFWNHVTDTCVGVYRISTWSTRANVTKSHYSFGSHHNTLIHILPLLDAHMLFFSPHRCACRLLLCNVL